MAGTETRGEHAESLVYVFDPHWVGNCQTLVASVAAGCSGPVTLPASRGNTREDGQLFWTADPLSKHVKLALDGLEASLGNCQLRPQLFGLPPQPTGTRTDVERRNQDQARPEQQPPHAAAAYPFGGIDLAGAAYASRAARAPL